MSIVLRSDFENVKAQLEDTQESLAAAFARIEVFRQREKLLLAEVSKLRTAQAAHPPAGDKSQHQHDSSSVSTADAAAGQTSAQQQDSTAAASTHAAPPSTSSSLQEGPTQQQDPGPDLPCYITEVEGHLPVMLLSSSGRKTPGSIVITPDYVDFVDVRARIKRHAFIGISAASKREQAAGKQGLKLKSFLPSCISPRQGLQPPSPAAPCYPKPPGGPHLVTPPDASVGGGSGTPVTTSVTNAGTNTGAWMAAAAAADIQPEASGSSGLSWQQQLHFQDLPPPPAAAGAAAVGSPQRARRSSAGNAVSSPLNIKSPRSPTPEAVLSTTPETPSGWASPHSLRHCPTWHAGHTSGPGEMELTETAAAAAAASGGGGSPRGSNSSNGSGGWLAGEGKGVWKILWRGGGMQQQLSFEATHTT